MKNRVIALLLCLILGTLFTLSVSAEADRLYDGAELLTASEEASVRTKLDSVSEKYDIDVVVVTVNGTEGESVRDFADDYFDYGGYGYDGVLLLISMEGRDWYISTSGECMDAFSDSDIDSIGDLMSGDLGDGDYAEAFLTFAKECDSYMDIHINGEPFSWFSSVVIALIIGLIVALIATGVMKGKLKSVSFQSAAANYVRAGSFKVTESRDSFLYSTVSRRAKPKQSSSSSRHVSSSGRSHGGGGGKF